MLPASLPNMKPMSNYLMNVCDGSRTITIRVAFIFLTVAFPLPGTWRVLRRELNP